MALKRGANPERDDRTLVFGADTHDFSHLIGGLGKDDRIGQLTANPGGGVAVVLTDGCRDGKPLTKTLAENADSGLMARGLVILSNGHG